MTADTDLSGLTVLVIEDEFLLADELQALLSDAGAEVVGPFPRADDALAALKSRRPDRAVLDVNLGDGADFTTARRLSALGVPFVFVTGYDPSVIPADLRQAPCLQKPLAGAEMPRSLSSIDRT